MQVKAVQGHLFIDGLPLSQLEQLRDVLQPLLIGSKSIFFNRECPCFFHGLSDVAHDKKRASNFSLGMRQRLGIAMQLLGEPEFLILDEPMNGLDPAGIVELRELILKLNRERNITFLISSHILSELSLVANKYGIISKGHIIKEITAEQLQSEMTKTTDITVDNTEKLVELLGNILSDAEVSYIPNGARIKGNIELNRVLAAIIEANINIKSVSCRESSFEEYYLETIGGHRA